VLASVGDGNGQPVPAWHTDRKFIPGALLGRGAISGVPVNCLSADMQIHSHAGYKLPPTHQADLARLRASLGS